MQVQEDPDITISWDLLEMYLKSEISIDKEYISQVHVCDK